MTEVKIENHRMFIELEYAQRRGITIFLDGLPSSPVVVMDAVSRKDDEVFMPDYVVDERGEWTELRIDKLGKL